VRVVWSVHYMSAEEIWQTLQRLRKRSFFPAWVREATSARHKLRYTKYRDAIDRITSALDTDSEQKLVWHKTCFVCYTDKGKIKRLHTSQVSRSEPSTSKEGQDKSDGGRTSLRNRSKPTDWELCVFCQKHEAKVKLSAVTTFKVSWRFTISTWGYGSLVCMT